MTETILVPVTQFITEAEEKCEEVGQWVDEQVSQPVERWISTQEERCRELAWWNPVRWFCEIVTVVVKVVEWVVVTVTKWVVTIVCQVVVKVVGIVVTFVLRVVSWAVSFLVCLFTDPLEALRSFADLWQIIVETVEDIFELVDTLLGDVVGILDDLNRLLDSVGSSAGWLGVVVGPVRGVKDWVRNLVEDIRDLISAVKDIVAGLLGLNLCRIIRGFTDLGTGIVRGLLDTGFSPVVWLIGGPYAAAIALGIRGLGAAIAGVRDSINKHQLEDVIRDAIEGAFGADSDRTERSLEKVGIGAGTMGLPFRADARRLFLSSRSTVLDLADLHRRGVVNLHSLAGHLADCSEALNEPDGEVVYTGTNLRVSYADIRDFLDLGADSVPSFQVFPITRAKFRTHLRASQRKALALGVWVTWEMGELEAISTDEIPLNASDEDPPGDPVQQAMFGRMGRAGATDDLSILPSVSHFHYVKRTNGTEPFGLTSWFRPALREFGPSGVTYRNRTPDWVFRWVLAHEMGHYWGIDHTTRSGGNRSLDEIMFSPSAGVAVSGSMVYEYLLGGGEPRFTLDDARTAWDWIVGPAAGSLLP